TGAPHVVSGQQGGAKGLARLWVGISGWSYPEWRGTVYPPRLPARLWLPHYATLFDTVELNVAFYRLLRPADIERWRAATPPGFLFAVKGSRFLTHTLKLAKAERALERYFAGIAPLGDRAGPVVFQTPPTLPV